MRATRRLSIVLPLLVLLLVLLGVATGVPWATAHPAPPTTARGAEVARIRAHFDSVLVEFHAATPRTALAPEALARRTELAARLRAYREAGDFPHNYDFPGRAVPYFVDRGTGAFCAVAHLLAATGRRDIVDRVARSDNNVWVADLAGDTAFTSWLSANGITLAEAARIQVPYIIEEPRTPAQQSRTEARNRAFMVAAPTAFGAAAIASAWNALGNADGHRRAGSVIGIASGLATVAGGAMVAGSPGAQRGIGALGLLVGGTSVALGVRTMRRHGAFVAAREAERTRGLTMTSVAPMVTTDAGAGVSLTLRF
jgi:hypothetical protein